MEAHAREHGLTPIQFVEDGEVLGWSWLFPPYYWHFDARAVEDTDAVFFYGTPLREECEADHDLGYEMVKRVAEVMLNRLEATRRHLVERAREGIGIRRRFDGTALWRLPVSFGCCQLNAVAEQKEMKLLGRLSQLQSTRITNVLSARPPVCR